MSDLHKATFGELAKAGILEFSDGYRTKRSEHGTPGIPILRVADVLDGKIAATFGDYVREEFRPAMGDKISQPGDIVLTTKGTVGRVAMIPQELPELVYSPQLCYFRVKPNSLVAPQYLYHWFRSDHFRNQASYRKSQTDMADYINLRDIHSLVIQIPEKGQQQGITEVLGALDAKIAVNEGIFATALDLAEAIYSDVSSHAYRHVLLGDLLELRYGKALPSAARLSGSIPVYGSGGISGSHNEALVPGPGIIVGRKGTVGSVYWSECDFYPIDTTFYIELRQSVPMEFAYFLLRQCSLKTMNSDSAVPGLNRNEVHALPARVPSAREMQSFYQKVRPIFALRSNISTESARLAELRDFLLPRLMSGEIRVREAEKVVEDAV